MKYVIIIWRLQLQIAMHFHLLSIEDIRIEENFTVKIAN